MPRHDRQNPAAPVLVLRGSGGAGGADQWNSVQNTPTLAKAQLQLAAIGDNRLPPLHALRGRHAR